MVENVKRIMRVIRKGTVLICFWMMLLSITGIVQASDNIIYRIDGTAADNSRLDVKKTWNYVTGKGVNVAVIDTGFDLYNSEIHSNIKGVYNADTGSTKWSSVHSSSASHGTSCAKNIVRVAPDVNLYLIKAGANGYLYSNQIYAGVDWAKSKKCRVINMSFGSDGYNSTEYEEFRAFTDAGGMICASGGNSGKNKHHYPASYDNTLSVGAAQYNASKKKYVVISKATYNNRIDLVAPGGSTSASTPYATGVAALLFEAKPSMTGAECMRILRSTAKDLGTSGKDNYYGYGLIQPYAALKKVLNITTPAKSISMSSKKATLDPGDTKTLSYKLKPASSKDKVTWKSSNTSVATVNSSGKVTAKNPGKATITAKTSNGKKATCVITVRPDYVDTMTIANYKSGNVLKKKLYVYWKRDSKVSGYQIQIATNSSFTKNVKKVTISKNSTTTKTITGLKTGRGYYARIRSYKKIGGKKVYGGWIRTSRPVTVR